MFDEYFLGFLRITSPVLSRMMFLSTRGSSFQAGVTRNFVKTKWETSFQNQGKMTIRLSWLHAFNVLSKLRIGGIISICLKYTHRYTCRPNIVCNYYGYETENITEMQKKINAEKQFHCEEKLKEMEGNGEYFVYWNTSVSDNCCLYCNNTVYKADTVINTAKLEDKCKNEETLVCSKMPGYLLS